MVKVVQLKSNAVAPSESEDGVVRAVRLLLQQLTPEDRERILSEFRERPAAAPRAGDVLGAVVRLLPRRVRWTVDDVKAGVDAAGVSATPKEVYNALGYLQRRGQVRRVGYGRYEVAGALLELPDDIDGPPTYRDTEHDA